jgi:hypothetical protein
MLYDQLQDNEYSNIYENEYVYISDSEINVKVSSYGKQNVSCGEENACDNSNMQHGIRSAIGMFAECYSCKKVGGEAKVTLPQAYCNSMPRHTVL